MTWQVANPFGTNNSQSVPTLDDTNERLQINFTDTFESAKTLPRAVRVMSWTNQNTRPSKNRSEPLLTLKLALVCINIGISIPLLELLLVYDDYL